MNKKERDKMKKRMLKQGWEISRESDEGILFSQKALKPSFEEAVEYYIKKCRVSFRDGIIFGVAAGFIISAIIELLIG